MLLIPRHLLLVENAEDCACLTETRQNLAKKEKNTMLLKEYGFEHIFHAYIQALRSITDGTEAKLVKALRVADKNKEVSLLSFMESASQKEMKLLYSM